MCTERAVPDRAIGARTVRAGRTDRGSRRASSRRLRHEWASSTAVPTGDRTTIDRLGQLFKDPLSLRRLAAALLAVLAVPFIVAAVSFTDDVPIRAGEPSPRGVQATAEVVLVDEAATDEARERARQGVTARYTADIEATGEITSTVRRLFEAVREARAPVESTVTPDPTTPAPTTTTSEDGEVATVTPAPVTPEPTTVETVPSAEAQLATLQDVLDEGVVAEDGLQALVALSDAELNRVANDTIEIAEDLARLQIVETGTALENATQLSDVVDVDVAREVALASIPDELKPTVITPLLRSAMRPTLVVDSDATEAARQAAEENVEDVFRSWNNGEFIVRAGDVVDEIEVEALRQLDLLGSDPVLDLLRAAAAMALVSAVVALYLWQMQPKVWASGRRLLALSACVTGYAVVAAAVSLLVDAAGDSWWYAMPAGALAMLAAILVTPVAGLVTILPAVAILLMLGPGEAAPAVFAATLALVSVPLVSDVASRQDLRSATLRAVLIYPVAATVIAVAFGQDDIVGIALAAGAVNGFGTVMLVQGALPALESIFRLPTVTALLDLADRNHPLLRQVETRALGTYNHSVMVAALVERACRDIGANPLLGQVSALYHDVGKVRRPHFFIENQQGIGNPHDDLAPEVSARILHDHLTDGVAMATEHRLPPEVIDNIGSHHGTMVVGFFFSKACSLAEEAGDERSSVDESAFRYPGAKPRSKEAAILFMADSCEATTRAAAMRKGTLSREEISTTVANLVAERVDDGQFDECELTFSEFEKVRSAIVEALVGIYHPRIAYPKGEDKGPDAGPAPTPATPTPPPDGGDNGSVMPLPAPREIAAQTEVDDPGVPRTGTDG